MSEPDENKTPPHSMSQEDYDQLCTWYVARLRTFSDPAFTPAALVNADRDQLQQLVGEHFADLESPAENQPETNAKDAGMIARFKRWFAGVFQR